MSIADPITPAFTLVNSTLTGDATLMALISGVYQGVALDVTYTKPYCVMFLQSPPVDTNTGMGAVRMLSRGIITVKFVGKASDGAAISSAFARADGLLCPNGRPLLLQGGTLNLYRVGTISFDEPISGTLWTHLGGQYRYEV